jgi:hypothetical protein
MKLKFVYWHKESLMNEFFPALRDLKLLQM